MEDLAMIRIYFLEMKIVINTMCNISSEKSRSTKKTFLTTNRNEGYYLKEDF